jgi:N-acetylmuramic acid 6-phosphate (MurNAc-6-P) etherase
MMIGMDSLLTLKPLDLEEVATEKGHSLTSALSTVCDKDLIQGLTLLNAVDQGIVPYLTDFRSLHFKVLYDFFKNTLSKKGRLFFIGSGSSGRIAVDLEARWRTFCGASDLYKPLQDFVTGLIGGGCLSFVRAKESFEDSFEAGQDLLKPHPLSAQDGIILISASGASKFNEGVAFYALEKNVPVFYFYNNPHVPSYTFDLFKPGRVIPLLAPIGPQAIKGSTRLQAATFALLALGGVLESFLVSLNSNVSEKEAHDHFKELIEDYEKETKSLEKYFKECAVLIQKQVAVFSSPQANFYKPRDENPQGYVTFVSHHSSFREVMIDTAELPPTFSTNPPRFTNEGQQKEAEIRCYLLESSDNKEGWETLLGHSLRPEETLETDALLLAMAGKGQGSYSDRPKGKENMVIGVFKGSLKEDEEASLQAVLKAVKTQGAETALIGIIDEETDMESTLQAFKSHVDECLLLKLRKPSGPLKLVSSVVLKLVLNMLSNGAMIGMKKVYGNIMIDLSVSNNKLKDRAIRILQEIYHLENPSHPPLPYEVVLEHLENAKASIQNLKNQGALWMPPVVRVAKAMIDNNCDAKAAVKLLQQQLNKKQIA